MKKLKNLYEKLLSYKFFDADCVFATANRCILNNEIIKHIIDHCPNLNAEVNVNVYYVSTRLIHLLCKNSNEKYIQYIIDKGVELERPDNYGYYPLHLICEYSTCSMIKYIINKGVNIKSNPKIDLIEIINCRSFAADEKKELLTLIE